LITHLFISITKKRAKNIVLLGKREDERKLGNGDPTCACVAAEDVGFVEGGINQGIKPREDNKELGN